MTLASPITVILFLACLVLFLIIIYERRTRNKIEVRFARSIHSKLEEIHIMLLVSILWIFFIMIIASTQNFLKVDINNWGDFLAGFFAPILFLWLVYGVFIQKKEFANALGALNMQFKEYEKNAKALEQQALQVEIQQLNSWFNRNINTIQSIKNSIFPINDRDEKSITEIYNKLSEDISSHNDYIYIFDDFKNILYISLHIENYLDNYCKINKTNELIIKSIEDIKNEFDILFKNDNLYIKAILTIVYFLIVLHDNPEYTKYKIYRTWIKEEFDIQNVISIEKVRCGDDFNLNNFLTNIIKNTYREINLDFKTGRIKN